MIFGLGGKLSGGKTVTAIRLAIYQAEKFNKKVIANIQLNFPDHINTEFMGNEEFVDFLKANYQNSAALKDKFYNSVLIFDEIVNLISARRSSTGLNEMITNFFMMAGKLNCDVIYTAQDRESMVDKRMRTVSNVWSNCYRFTEKGQPTFWNTRKMKEKVVIVVIMEFDLDILGVRIGKIQYDPSPFFKYYDTEEITLLDRSRYLRGGIKDLRKA